MSVGGSAAERAAEVRRLAEWRRKQADNAALAAAAWEAGADGERRLGAIVDELATDGFVHLPDRRRAHGGGNVDHFLIGPPGVFIIDAKAWAGEVVLDEWKTLRHNGRSRSEVQATSHATAVEVAASLDGLLAQKVAVRPAVCFVGEARLSGPAVVDRIKFLNATDLIAWVRRFSAQLDDDQICTVHDHLAVNFPSMTAEPAGEVPVEEPEELVVYLVPWKKGGQHRLYARSTAGADLGYLNLVSGQVASPSEEWETILAQLLPHYLHGDTPGLREAELSAEASGAVHRFLKRVLGRSNRSPERTILSCYRWKKHGKDRLYLNRIEPGGKKMPLGSFDLDTGMLRAERPGAAGVLGYCGKRFQQLELARQPRT